jgi:hypothetical protein
MGCAGISLVEPFAVQDDVVSGIDHIEPVGKSLIRLYLYIDHTPIDGSPPERVLVRKVVISLDDMPKAVRKTIRFMADRGIEIGQRDLSKLLS